MRVFSAIVFILYAGCSSGSETVSECYSSGQFRKFSNPSFSSYIMNVQTGESPRTDIYFQLPYNHLRFEKMDVGFRASYSLSIVIRNQENEIVQTKEVDRPISARSYEESVSSRFDFQFYSFTLAPAKYSLETIAIDNLSKLRYRSLEQFVVPDLTVPAASSILWLDDVRSGSDGISLRPILPASLSQLKDSLGMFQEIYHLRQDDTLTVIDTYSRHRAMAGTSDMLPFLMPPYRTPSDVCDTDGDSVYYRRDTVIVAGESGNIQLLRFHPLPATGGSLLRRKILYTKPGGTDTMSFSQPVFRRDHRLRFTLSIDEFTVAMKYILREQEFDSLSAAEGEQRVNKIRQFWDQRGGRERMNEFERRVIEANALFTTCVDGSRTAMGIVYFICGIPDFIECRGAFTETWFYHVGERAFAFQFRREKAGSQHFELLPFSVNESVWQYFVDRWRKRS